MDILLLGATGLVGGHLFHQALDCPHIQRIVVVVRQPLAISHGKIEQVVLQDFNQLEQFSQRYNVDAVICALGTTLKKAGSKSAFRQVDYEYPLRFAKSAKQQGARFFILNSAMGASVHSPFFYSRIKGQLEEALIALDFEGLTLVRPALIDGHRQERRFAEHHAATVLKALAPIVPKSYRVNPAKNIAKALLEAALAQHSGVQVIRSDQLI